MLIGEYSYAIDDKGRLISAKFREAMAALSSSPAGWTTVWWRFRKTNGSAFPHFCPKKHGEIP
ncbi:MAG: hypothetical protein ACLUBZ_10875 [Ruthenibacterium lactatiformans]|uniref:hypothetical protein n=1 Tax=Ruthenibacterium lactatiformans TaxID=1550024 RepID=UPI0039945346